ncbi:MAG: hypothetical protein PWQ06_1084, partial [Anaerophaga sp.]|nr:hypothetical protein [Anaerophaga sp.]
VEIEVKVESSSQLTQMNTDYFY